MRTCVTEILKPYLALRYSSGAIHRTRRLLTSCALALDRWEMQLHSSSMVRLRPNLEIVDRLYQRRLSGAGAGAGATAAVYEVLKMMPSLREFIHALILHLYLRKQDSATLSAFEVFDSSKDVSSLVETIKIILQE